MKNIHILPTDQPSKLGYISESKTYHLYNNNVFLDELANAINIYITSSEEIKEGDWILYGASQIVKIEIQIDKNSEHFKIYGMGARRKIILTTDQKLIEDGVQSIEDEFLEWFVKNSSCEFVEVNKKLVEFPLTFKMMYKIIIPQEEPKQDLEKEMFELEQELDIPSSMRWHNSKPKQEKKPHSFCETPEENCTFNYCDENGCQNRKRELVEPHEQETLEEYIEKYSAGIIEPHIRTLHKMCFKDGAKWMEERRYSDEDVLNIIFKFTNDFDLKKNIEITSEEQRLWFEQFKKK